MFRLCAIVAVVWRGLKEAPVRKEGLMRIKLTVLVGRVLKMAELYLVGFIRVMKYDFGKPWRGQAVKSS